MKAPQWLAEKIAATGVQVLDGKMTRADGDAVIAAVTRDHPEFGSALGEHAGIGLFGKWLREHESNGDLFQTQMFPGLPASLTVAPKKTAHVADMTGPDLDKARRMLYARTQNAMDGAKGAAEKERAAFDAFYDKVRPLLKDGMTVSDVIGTAAMETTAVPQ